MYEDYLHTPAADLSWPETMYVIASQYNVTLRVEYVLGGTLSLDQKNPVSVSRQFDYGVQLFVRHSWQWRN